MKRIILFLILTLLSGCNYYELDNIALVSTVKINCVSKNCNLEILFHNKNVKPLYVQDKNFKKSINKIRIKSPLNLEFNHLNEIIINKNIDSKTYKEILSYFSNKTNNFYIFIDSEAKSSNLKEIYMKINNKIPFKTSTYKEIKHNKYYILGSTNFNDCYLAKNYTIIKHLSKDEFSKIKKETT